MEEIKVFYDRTGETLTVWFGNPKDEHVCEMTREEVILMKDKADNVIGFEALHVRASSSEPVRFSFEEFPVEEWVANYTASKR